jgi:glycosyltransferase involved in cell wall biosynthesis
MATTQPGPLPQVHCELAPMLVNRTAVYKMCRQAPLELMQRGFEVHCSALLARLSAETTEPSNRFERRLFEYSRRWLLWAIRRPHHFRRTHRLAGQMARWRHRAGTLLSLDPLYPLFHGCPDRGVAIVYDVTPVTDQEWHPGGVGYLYELAYQHLACTRFQLVASCRNTADQLRVRWGIPPSRIHVLPLGLFPLPEQETSEPTHDAAPFLLFVGTVEPRKNVAGLIRAYAASRLLQERGLRLRLIGMKHEEDHPIMLLARSTPGVEVAGFVSDTELAAAYRRCYAFVYPSFCEGFGLPLLEAMHRGCLCLSTMTGASPEVAGDAALYVNPYDVADITRGLRQLAAMSPDEAHRLREKARRRSQAFTWQRFYDGLAELLRLA